jgi:hypothetical protein
MTGTAIRLASLLKIRTIRIVRDCTNNSIDTPRMFDAQPGIAKLVNSLMARVAPAIPSAKKHDPAPKRKILVITSSLKVEMALKPCMIRETKFIVDLPK